MVEEDMVDPVALLGESVMAQTGPPSSPLGLAPCLVQGVDPGVQTLPCVDTALGVQAQEEGHKNRNHPDRRKDRPSTRVPALERAEETCDDL